MLKNLSGAGSGNPITELLTHKLCLSKISGILLKETVSCAGRSGRTSTLSHRKGWEDAVSHHAMPCDSSGFGLSVSQKQDRRGGAMPYAVRHWPHWLTTKWC